MAEARTGSNGSLLGRVIADMEAHKCACRVNETRDAVLVECRFFPANETAFRDSRGRAGFMITVTAGDLQRHVSVTASQIWQVGGTSHLVAVREALSQIESLQPPVRFSEPDDSGWISATVLIPADDVVGQPARAVLDAVGWISKVILQADPVIRSAIEAGTVLVEDRAFHDPTFDEDERIQKTEELFEQLEEEKNDRVLGIGTHIRSLMDEHRGRLGAKFNVLFKAPMAYVFVISGTTILSNKMSLASEYEDLHLAAIKNAIEQALPPSQYGAPNI
jgi:hypothetical protein